MGFYVLQGWKPTVIWGITASNFYEISILSFNNVPPEVDPLFGSILSTQTVYANLKNNNTK